MSTAGPLPPPPELRPGETVNLERGSAETAERVEINRSAKGQYYWKLVVLGPIDWATTRALEADTQLAEHYGDRASRPEPEQ